MNRLNWSLVILSAGCLLLWAVLAALPRLARYQEPARAMNVMTDCCQFVFRAAMDNAGLDQPSELPRKLEDVPGWKEHVASVTDPEIRKFYGLIDWHPPENAATNDEIASIELPHGRIVALNGGSVYYLVRKTPQ